MKVVLACILCFALLNCSPKKESIDSSTLDSLISANMKAAGIVGMAAAVIVDKQLVWTKGYGYSDRAKKKNFTPTTIMNIGSISKTVTGACVMRAVEAGKLSLDVDINRYLPFKVYNPGFPQDTITLRHLATHTSGIVDASPTYGNTYYYGGDNPEKLGDFLKEYFTPGGKYYKAENFINYKPGARRQYSNIGAGLAGYILETVTGEGLNLYSKKHFFDPLGMNDTGWFLTEVALENHSTLYEKQADSVASIKLYGLVTYPDGGVRTSVSDLSKFFTMMLNRGEGNGVRLLLQETVDAMTRPQFADDNKPENMDLTKQNSGIFWSIQENGTVSGHSGGDPGVSTRMYYDSLKQVGVIFFINTSTDEEGYKKVGVISEGLWKFAASLKAKLTATTFGRR